MTSPEYFQNKSEASSFKVKSNDLSTGFLAAMRFNALQRGMKWADTYELTSRVSLK